MRRYWSIGFGLEHAGLLARRFPVLFTLLLALVSAAAVWNVTKVRFDGDVAAVLPEDSEAYRNYFANRERFRDFGRDITLIVQSDRLFTAQGLEELRYLQLELAVTEGVANVTSMFSLPLPDPQTGALAQFFPPELTDDAQARALVEQLLERWPQARSLAVPAENLAVLLVTLEGVQTEAGLVTWPSFVAMKAAAEDAAPEDFRLLHAGLTPIGGTIVSALVADQMRLTVVGLILGTLIAFVVYRSLAAAILCAIPPALTVLWSLGLIGFLGVRINYLTTVLPTLALIIAFADGIVLYFRWQASNAVRFDPDANLVEALKSVGPASSLTSITTVLAFFSFSFASGNALHVFSWLGMACVTIAFFAVIVGLPVACHWAVRLGLVRAGKVRQPAFARIGQRFERMISPRPLAYSVGAIVAVFALGYVHTQVRPEYRITDYLPVSSEVREAEALSNRVIGGRSLLLLTTPKAEAGSILSPANLARLREVESALAGLVDRDRIISPSTLADGVGNPAALQRLSQELSGAEGASRSTFESSDGTAMLVTIRIPSDQPIAFTLSQIRDIRARLTELPYGDEVVVTGFDVLMAEEFTRLIDQLRASLIIAILLGVTIVGIATLSPVLALAALTPNLLPILGVEFALWLRGGAVNLSEVIALTIAFGIAIDNAVHVINFFGQERARGAGVTEAVSAAMREVGPALAASTTIICVSTLVTQISVLPMVPVLGVLMIATLAVALFSNLAILPANILALKGWLSPRSGKSREARKIKETQE